MTLIERLEAAGEGSRELDDEIATLLFTDKQRHCIKGLSDEAGGMWMFRYPNGSIGSSLRFTSSLDAAMTLVPENADSGGERFRLEQWNDSGIYLPHIRASAWVAGAERVYAATPALALCIAALRARGVS